MLVSYNTNNMSYVHTNFYISQAFITRHGTKSVNGQKSQIASTSIYNNNMAITTKLTKLTPRE